MSDADDDELLTDLARVLGRVDPPPEHVLEAARAALEVRALDAELAALVEGDLLGAGTRALTVEDEPLVFELDDVVIEVEVRDGSLEIQVAPATAVPVVVRSAAGSVELVSDAVGRASAEVPADGPVRVEIVVDGRRIATDWFVP